MSGDLLTRLGQAVAYWERKRLIYNGVLAILVLICWGQELFATTPQQWLGAALVLLVLAGLANVLFCCAYPLDLLLQYSPLRDFWADARWAIFWLGTLLAGTLAMCVMLGKGMG